VAADPPAYGGSLSSPLAERREAPPGLGQGSLGTLPVTSDPAFQPPRDPLVDLADRKAGAQVIYRDVPITTIQTTWTVADIQHALASFAQGQFDHASQLVEAILGDDRLHATMGSRLGGLFGSPIKFTAADNTSAAQECLDAWQEVWPSLAPEYVLKDVQGWGVMLGLSFAQIVWDTSEDLWKPHLLTWHPRYVWYHPILRQYMASTMDGLVTMIPADGKWFIHAPHGMYRGWMRGAVRAVAQPWLIRQFAYRDWARYSERHGMPIMRAYVPAAADPVQRSQFINAINNLGQETAVMLPKGVDENWSYDLDVLEASDGAWQSFDGLIQRCETSITLAIQYQNLTTEVKEGSFAAARVHGDVRQAALESDNNALKMSIYSQLARPFAAFNFGNPDLAPWTEWDVTPPEDNEQLGRVFQAFGSGLLEMRKAGFQVNDVEKLAKAFGLKLSLGQLQQVEPLQSGANDNARG
jgi:phage gp29-like protein